KFNNAIIQSGYLQKLSKVLSITEEALRTELKKVREIASKTTSKTIEAREESAQKQFRTVEIDILRLILEDDRFVALTKSEVDLTDFQDTQIREVISKIFELFDQGKQITSLGLMSSFQDE